MIAVPATLTFVLLVAAVAAVQVAGTGMAVGLGVFAALSAGTTLSAVRRSSEQPALAVEGSWLVGKAVPVRRPVADYRYVIATHGTGWIVQIACPDDRPRTLVRVTNKELALSTGEPVNPQTVSAALEHMGVQPGLKPLMAREWQPRDGTFN